MAVLSLLGCSIPPNETHAVSVSLPLWKDVTGYELGEDRVVSAMQVGYPRFFINKRIQKLAEWAMTRFGQQDECCFLYPTARVVNRCQDFLAGKSPPVSSRIESTTLSDTTSSDMTLHMVFCKADDQPKAREFWQHTGEGISSRYADRCLAIIAQKDRPLSPITRSPSQRGFGRNRHYARSPSIPEINAKLDHAEDTGPECDAASYVEERYGRNLARTLAPLAKIALRKRIAGVLNDQEPGLASASKPPSPFSLKHLSLEEEKDALSRLPANSASSRGVSRLTEDDVYLFPTGMTAIFHAQLAVLKTMERTKGSVGKSICFGFPYTDTLKILEKWGPGCIHFGNGTDEDLDKLEEMLDTTPEQTIAALHTEFPSNPLLRCADLPRLRKLADKHNFMIVVDETIGTFANVEILPFADIAVSSLTKIFSGDCNVMAGSLVLNPDSRHYQALKRTLQDQYDDNLFEEDAVFVERNSRDYLSRIVRIDESTEQLCDQLKKQLQGKAVVHYPKFSTPEHYAKCLRVHEVGVDQKQPGYGGLFSLSFNSAADAQVFFDNLPCEKGPSLGTNFTLACPYTVLAHFHELDWTRSWGVSENLVRVSVGLEPASQLLSQFSSAVEAITRSQKT